MNGHASERNRRSVVNRSVSSRLSGAALVLALAASGCAPARHPPPVIGTQPGVTTLLFSNRIARPLELRGLTVEVDGLALPLATIPVASDDVVLLARVPMKAGQHVLHLLATAVAHASKGDEGRSVLCASQVFRVGDEPSMVRIDLVPASVESGMRAALRAEHAALEPAIDERPPARSDSARCAYLEPIPRALCGADAALAGATATRDPVKMSCVRDKLARMQSIGATLTRAPSAEAERRAEQRIEALSGEIERCAESIEAMRPDGATVIRVAD